MKTLETIRRRLRGLSAGSKLCLHRLLLIAGFIWTVAELCRLMRLLLPVRRRRP